MIISTNVKSLPTTEDVFIGSGNVNSYQTNSISSLFLPFSQKEFNYPQNPTEQLFWFAVNREKNPGGHFGNRMETHIASKDSFGKIRPILRNLPQVRHIPCLFGNLSLSSFHQEPLLKNPRMKWSKESVIRSTFCVCVHKRYEKSCQNSQRCVGWVPISKIKQEPSFETVYRAKDRWGVELNLVDPKGNLDLWGGSKPAWDLIFRIRNLPTNKRWL